MLEANQLAHTLISIQNSTIALPLLTKGFKQNFDQQKKRFSHKNHSVSNSSCP